MPEPLFVHVISVPRVSIIIFQRFDFLPYQYLRLCVLELIFDKVHTSSFLFCESVNCGINCKIGFVRRDIGNEVALETSERRLTDSDYRSGI